MGPGDFSSHYVKLLTGALNNTDISVIEEIIALIEKAHKEKNTIYVIGNGGSAATASHMANDLGVGLQRRDILSLNIFSLCDNVAVLTALANDVGYENIFYEQLRNTIKKDDVLIAISCSGNSPNIIKAVEYCKGIGSTIIGCTGFDGGVLKKLSDINFHIETDKGEYGIVEDMHMILDHLIFSYFLQKGTRS